VVDLLARLTHHPAPAAEEHLELPPPAAETRAAFPAYSGGYLRTEGTRTGLVDALHVGLHPDGFGARLVEALVNRIEAKRGHLDAGFVGTFLLPRVLSDGGANEVPYIRHGTFPSWLFEVAMGAPTIWEGWNSVRPDLQSLRLQIDRGMDVPRNMRTQPSRTRRVQEGGRQTDARRIDQYIRKGKSMESSDGCRDACWSSEKCQPGSWLQNSVFWI
jgi:hypothetical protein